MHTSISHQARLRSVFEIEWSRLSDAYPAVAHADASPTYWLAEEILHDVTSNDVCGMDELPDRVRRRVLDRSFVGETGDACMDPHYRVPVDVEVRLITAVLGRVLETHDYAHTV